MLFVIRNGKLVPTNPNFEDFYDVRNALGFVDAGEPMPGDIAVVVADGRQPLRRVPRDAVTITSVSEPNQDVYLFWAVNEDDGNEEVIVAFDNFDIANNDNDLWRIIGFDEWVQLPLNKELIRAFRNVEEARVCIHDDGLVFVPIVMGGGWQGVAVHGHDNPWDTAGIRNIEDRRLIEMVPIPSGWKVYNIIDWDVPPTIQGVLTETEAGKIPEILKDAELVCVIGTADGGAAIITRFREGEIGGTVIVGRTFTHEEAKLLLNL